MTLIPGSLSFVMSFAPQKNLRGMPDTRPKIHPSTAILSHTVLTLIRIRSVLFLCRTQHDQLEGCCLHCIRSPVAWGAQEMLWAFFAAVPNTSLVVLSTLFAFGLVDSLKFFYDNSPELIFSISECFMLWLPLSVFLF